MNTFNRSAGILMPVSSIPSPYGIGTFGREAYRFVDFIKECRHKYWQVLPMGPTSYGDSPYQGFSAFAGNPYFIDLDMLIEEKLITYDDVNHCDWGSDEGYVAYDKIYESRFKVLKKAFEEWKKTKHKEFEKFKKDNAEWLLDYALFMACKAHFNEVCWSEWDDDIKFRKKQALEEYKEKLAASIEFYEFLQFKFFEQWNKLKKYANDKGIEIIGDIPIYMAYDSADVWAGSGEFLLDENLTPLKVAGVPPDAFAELGQKWGNPLYDWNVMEKNGFSWWNARMKAMSKLYDVIRIDHFLGIVKYYTIPYSDPDARNGEYCEGPGKKLTDVINKAIGDKKLIAEDLGVSIPEAEKLLCDNGYPGMKVIEFALSGDRANTHLPFNYKTSNCVVYGGTHDNETLLGYFQGRGDWELGYAYDYLDTRDKYRMVDQVFRAAYGSVADLVIFQVQDILKLGNEARMNFPSTQGNNWKWRLRRNQLNGQHVQMMQYLASVFGRES